MPSRYNRTLEPSYPESKNVFAEAVTYGFGFAVVVTTGLAVVATVVVVVTVVVAIVVAFVAVVGAAGVVKSVVVVS